MIGKFVEYTLKIYHNDGRVTTKIFVGLVERPCATRPGYWEVWIASIGSTCVIPETDLKEITREQYETQLLIDSL